MLNAFIGAMIVITLAACWFIGEAIQAEILGGYLANMMVILAACMAAIIGWLIGLQSRGN